MSSCLKGDLEDLEKQLADLEKALGSNEPLVINFSTMNSNDIAVEKNASFGFKSLSSYSNYMEDNDDGTFEIYIERFGDIEWTEGAWIYFEYDANTDTFSDEQAGVYFYNQFRQWTNPYFDPDITGNTFEMTINSINTTTGQISVSINASTDNAASNNEYSGKPMSCSFTFNGKLPIFY
jgi:hypothetical protein